MYFIVPKKLRNLVLLVFSLIFYAWGEPVYITIMLFSTVFDYVNGLLLERFDNSPGKRKAVLITSVVGNLSILVFFKYTDFILTNINALFGTQIPLLDLALPIGISFYTFQTMSYTIDVYKRDVAAQKNIISFSAYVCMFPQLIAGPIVRYRTIAKEIDNRTITVDNFSQGITRFVTGLGKKVLLANNIGMLWEAISATQMAQMSVLGAWLGIIAFGFQIYFDFSGYSDMAIGMGRMFGFTFLENFNYPYISKSITEFWRRWHISMGTWFREYVYIPMGGNRVRLPRMYFNIFMVWFLTGLWHGASWNFVLWGLYFGVILVLEKTFLLRLLERIPRIFAHLYALVLILVGWALFAFDSLPQGLAYLQTMFGLSGLPLVNNEFWYYFLSYLPMLIILTLACLPAPKQLAERFLYKKLYFLVPVFSIAVFILSTAYLVDSSFNPFLYFRF